MCHLKCIVPTVTVFLSILLYIHTTSSNILNAVTINLYLLTTNQMGRKKQKKSLGRTPAKNSGRFNPTASFHDI